MGRLGLSVLVVIGFLFLTGCEEQKETDLFKAQDCVDKASAANVNTCLNYIDGDNSDRAQVLRCSAAFISQNIDETAIVEALENIDGEKGGDPTTPAIAALDMESTSISEAALETCIETNSRALTSLGHFANLASAMRELFGLTGETNSDDYDAAIAAYVASPPGNSAEKKTLGRAIINSQDSLCNAKDGLFKSDDVCIDINAAVIAGAGKPSAVADALMVNLMDQNN